MVEAAGGAFLTVAMLAAGGLLCGFAVWQLFGMWVQDRLISGFEFAIILCLFLALMGLAISVGGVISFVLLALLGIVGAMIPLMPVVAQKIGARRLEEEDIAKYRAALERQPDVPYPHRKLGEIYEQRGDWDRAIEHYQAYVQMHPVSGDIPRRLERCLEAKRREEMGLCRCPVCGADNLPEAVRCQECGFYLKGSQEILDTLTTPEMMQLWKWLIVVFLVPGLAIGLLARVIPPIISLIMLMCSVIATLIFMYGRMRR